MMRCTPTPNVFHCPYEPMSPQQKVPRNTAASQTVYWQQQLLNSFGPTLPVLRQYSSTVVHASTAHCLCIRLTSHPTCRPTCRLRFLRSSYGHPCLQTNQIVSTCLSTRVLTPSCQVSSMPPATSLPSSQHTPPLQT